MKNFKQIKKILQAVQIGLAIIVMVMMFKGMKLFFLFMKGG